MTKSSKNNVSKNNKPVDNKSVDNKSVNNKSVDKQNHNQIVNADNVAQKYFKIMADANSLNEFLFRDENFKCIHQPNVTPKEIPKVSNEKQDEIIRKMTTLVDNPKIPLIGDFTSLRFVVLGTTSSGKTTIINMMYAFGLLPYAMLSNTKSINTFAERNGKNKLSLIKSIYKDVLTTNNKVSLYEERHEIVNSNDYKQMCFENEYVETPNMHIKHDICYNVDVKSKMIENTKQLDNRLSDVNSLAKYCPPWSITDVPGFDSTLLSIGHARSFIKNEYHNFDIVYFIIDITKGFTTKDENELLQLIVENTEKCYNNLEYIDIDYNICKKAPYVIVLVNKCDSLYFDDSTNEYFMNSEQQCVFDTIKTKIQTSFKNAKGIEKYLLDVIPFCAKKAYLFTKLSVNDSIEMFDTNEIDDICSTLAFAEYNSVRSNKEKKALFEKNLIEKKIINDKMDSTLASISSFVDNSGYNSLKSILTKFIPNKTYIDNFNNINALYSNDELPNMELQLIVNTKQFTRMYSSGLSFLSLLDLKTITENEILEFDKTYHITEASDGFIHQFTIPDNNKRAHVIINEDIARALCMTFNMYATQIHKANGTLNTPNSAIFVWFLKQEFNLLAGALLEMLSHHDNCYILLMNYYNIRCKLDEYFPEQLKFMDNSPELIKLIKQSIIKTIGNNATFKVSSAFLLKIIIVLHKLKLLTCDVIDVMRTALVQRTCLMVYLHSHVELPATTPYNDSMHAFYYKKYRRDRTDIYQAAIVHDYIYDSCVDELLIQVFKESIQICMTNDNEHLSKLMKFKNDSQKTIDSIHEKISIINKTINSTTDTNLKQLEEERNKYNVLLIKTTSKFTEAFESLRDFTYETTRNYMTSVMYLLSQIRGCRNTQGQIFNLFDSNDDTKTPEQNKILSERYRRYISLWASIEMKSYILHANALYSNNSSYTNAELCIDLSVSANIIQSFNVIDYKKNNDEEKIISSAVVLDEYIIALFTVYNQKYSKYDKQTRYLSNENIKLYCAEMNNNFNNNFTCMNADVSTTQRPSEFVPEMKTIKIQFPNNQTNITYVENQITEAILK